MTVQPAERVETDLSVIEALDFEPEVPCENSAIHSGGVAPAAEWYVICRACGNSPARCDSCKQRIQSRPVTRTCRRCGGDFIPPDGIRFEPIRP